MNLTAKIPNDVAQRLSAARCGVCYAAPSRPRPTNLIRPRGERVANTPLPSRLTPSEQSNTDL